MVTGPHLVAAEHVVSQPRTFSPRLVDGKKDPPVQSL